VNHQGEEYDHVRLANTIASAPVAARDILAHILRDLEAFAGPVPQPDDITLLVLANNEALGTGADLTDRAVRSERKS